MFTANSSGTAASLSCNLPKEACAIQTPLKLEVWQELLSQHLDQEFASYILRGIEFGFRTKPNKWRLIVDLSAPENHSVNDGILKELASLSYMSIDDVVTAVVSMGKGSMLAKMDVIETGISQYPCPPTR